MLPWNTHGCLRNNERSFPSRSLMTFMSWIVAAPPDPGCVASRRAHGLAPAHRVVDAVARARVVEEDEFLDRARIGLAVLGELEVDFGLAMRLARQVQAEA